MKLLFRYNEDGTYCEDVIVNDINEAQEIVDNEIKFKKGLTDIRPTGCIISNISPKFIDGEWVENTEAVKVHLESLPKTKQLMSHEQMDELLTYLAGGKI